MDDFTARLLKYTEKVKERFDELTELISAPEIIADNRYFRRLAAERTAVEGIVEVREEILKTDTEYCKCLAELEGADGSLKEMLLSEISVLEKRMESLSETLRGILSPKTDNDGKDAVLEIRAIDGEEGGAFAFEIYQQYQKYAEKNKFIFDTKDIFWAGANRLKYAAVLVSGEGAYGALAYESGMYKAVYPRGRVQKKAASVSVKVTPEAEEISVDINEKDIRIDLFHSGGAGGQNVNKVESAVRVTHLPTGITAVCQDERSQLKNKERAMNTLRLRLNEHYEKQRLLSEEKNAPQEKFKKNKIIRTYNYAEGTVTDHRVELTLPLEQVIGGGLSAFTSALKIADTDI